MHEEEENEFFNNQFQADLSRFEEALENDSFGFFDADVLEQIIDHFLIKNQIKKALKACEHAMYQFPYSNLFKLRKAQIVSAIGKLDESLELLEQLDDQQENSSELFATKASIYSQLKKHQKAIEFFKLAIENCQEEELDELYLDLAIEYETVKEFDNAIITLTKIIEINPNNEAALYEIAFCYDLSKEFEKSIEFYTKYIDSHPYSFTAWYNLGNSYCRIENFEKAVWAYDYCTIINDKFASAFFNMGNALGNLGKFKEAIEAYLTCLEMDGEDGLTLNYLGEAYEKLEEYDKAIEFYQRALKTNDQLSEPWLGIGIVKDLQGYTKESINFIKKAVALKDDNADYWHVLAEAYEKLEDWDEATIAFEKSIELSTHTNLDAIISLAKVKSIESNADAIDFIGTFTVDGNDAIETNALLVALYWNNGQFTDSLELFEQLLILDVKHAKKVIAHLPEAKEIQEFIAIMENYI
jgi:tetratricopeptide (TPR) repeat protein